MITKNISDEKLIMKAKAAMQYSYSPYSNFRVGAAVLSENGNIYTGCNIENASFGATNCAERTAVFKAVSNADTRLVRLAIVSQKDTFTPPCGICRQVMSEFMKEDAVIILEAAGEIKKFTLKSLLPHAFKDF